MQLSWSETFTSIWTYFNTLIEEPPPSASTSFLESLLKILCMKTHSLLSGEDKHCSDPVPSPGISLLLFEEPYMSFTQVLLSAQQSQEEPFGPLKLSLSHVTLSSLLPSFQLMKTAIFWTSLFLAVAEVMEWGWYCHMLPVHHHENISLFVQLTLRWENSVSATPSPSFVEVWTIQSSLRTGIFLYCVLWWL